MVYRTAGLMDAALREIGDEESLKVMKAFEEYAVECSILKVFSTEVLDFVVDEAVQIYGGYGYTKDYGVERYYRDAPLMIIGEGTNEVMRLVIAKQLLRMPEYQL